MKNVLMVLTILLSSMTLAQAADMSSQNLYDTEGSICDERGAKVTGESKNLNDLENSGVKHEG